MIKTRMIRFFIFSFALTAIFGLLSCEKRSDNPTACGVDGDFRSFGWNGEFCLDKDEIRRLNNREMGVGAYFLIYENRMPTYFSDTIFFFPNVTYDTLRGEVYPRMSSGYYGEFGTVKSAFVPTIHAEYCRDSIGSSTFIRSPRTVGVSSAVVDYSVNDARLPEGMEVQIVNNGHDVDLNCTDQESGLTVFRMQGNGIGVGTTQVKRVFPDLPSQEWPIVGTYNFRVERIPVDW